MSVLAKLDAATAPLHADADADAHAMLGQPTAEHYRRFLGRMFSFVSPLERSLADTPGLGPYLDARRLQKHLLLKHDLETLGLREIEVDSIPQCMWIPWFDNVHTALGWAYVSERATLHHTALFRHLASVLPGEVAFGSSYLKCYFGAVGETWRSFGEGLELAGTTPADVDRIVDAARAGFRHWRRWRHTLDGKALSVDHEPEPEPAAPAPPPPPGAAQLALETDEEL